MTQSVPFSPLSVPANRPDEALADQVIKLESALESVYDEATAQVLQLSEAFLSRLKAAAEKVQVVHVTH